MVDWTTIAALATAGGNARPGDRNLRGVALVEAIQAPRVFGIELLYTRPRGQLAHDHVLHPCDSR